MERFTLDSREVELKKPLKEAVKTVTEFEGHNIGVSVVDARIELSDGIFQGQTLIWPQAYGARLDRFEIQRQETIAEALKARVIAVELPGVGDMGANSSLAQKVAMLRGDFGESAHAMLGAIQEVVSFQSGEEVELLLYSQGVVEGVEMARALGEEAHGLKLKIPRVTMIEAVNDQKWFLPQLLSKIGKEDAHTDRYLEQNAQYDWLVEPSDRTPEGAKERKQLDKKQNPSLLSGGIGLRKSFMPTLLRAIEEDKANHATGLSESRIDIYRFNGSGVARMEENHLTAQQLAMAVPLGEVSLTDIESPKGHQAHRHPAVHSMPNIDIMSRHLFK